MKARLWIVGLCLLALTGCGRREVFPVEPHIEFVRIDKIDNGTGVDNQADLVVYFEDGDGDIGLNETDTDSIFAIGSPYYYDFFIHYYEKQNGVWTEVELPTPLHARLPHLSDNVPEAIKGEITITTFINNYTSPYDTIMLSCQLVDRALHESNIITTPEIIVQK
ncbi:MAG: hypothetical protein IKR77_01575 [Bacteroidales bacterium]|nr:hypothetical protein [Bacteroidales bacterium]